MPRAIQHTTTLNLPHLGLVLPPGIEVAVTPDQARELEALGVTILPDEPTPYTQPFPTPATQPPDPAPDEEHDR
jgi:hypothetical protein